MHLLRFCVMFEKFRVEEADSHLLTYLAVMNRQSAPVEWSLLSMEWIRETADRLCDQLLTRCSTDRERIHLLRLLSSEAYSERYVRLFHSYTILGSTGLDIKPHEDASVVVELLLKHGLFKKARAFSEAQKMPADVVTVAEARAMLAEYRQSCLWTVEKTRATVWEKCQQLFTAQDCSPELAGQFYLDIADSGEEQALTMRERAVLLAVALQWLATPWPRGSDKACGTPEQLQALRHKIWLIKIRDEAANGGKVVAPPPTITLLNEKIALTFNPELERRIPLGVRTWGTIDHVVHSAAEIWVEGADDCGDEAGANGDDSRLQSDAERQALDAIVGRLLSIGDVVQAHRLAKYFAYSRPDIGLVQAAILLAQETIMPLDLPQSILDTVGVGVRDMDTISALREIAQHCRAGLQLIRRVTTNYQVQICGL